MKTDLKSLTFLELEAFCLQIGLQKYRAKQIYPWLHKGVTSFDEMTNLSAVAREKLAENAQITTLTIEKKQVSKFDKTIKYLFCLMDGQMVESVLMYYEHGVSLCISTQAGCRMGCAFCASTIDGLSRNLMPSEILDQVIFASKDCGERVGHIVLMGIGEPLDNYDNVIKFLYNVNDKNGLNIGMRNISLSTCGLVDQIYKLAKLNLQITLSVSLHAPSDEIRDTIMPINKKYNMDALLKACYDYFAETGRRISFEYTLIDGVNNSRSDALLLAKRLKNLHCHVNLIEVNNVRERGFISTKNKTREFLQTLIQQQINATVRRKLGSDIDASCGQLRAKQGKEEAK